MLSKKSPILLLAFVALSSCGRKAPVIEDPHANHKPEAENPVAEKKSAEEMRVAINVPPEQQRKIGLRTVIYAKQDLTKVIRTVGSLVTDETSEHSIHLRVTGYIEKMYADYSGKMIKQGQALFALYSPDVLSTQQEYLSAHQNQTPDYENEICRAALDRLRYWGVPEYEIRSLVTNQKAKRLITFTSPVSGYIVSKTAIQGTYVTPELELYKIARLSKLWAIATLYESDLAVVHEGDTAKVTLSVDPSTNLVGKITYLYPELDKDSRTVKARIEVPNKKGLLKPGMFVNVEIRKKLGYAGVLPDDAIIDTGMRKIVFVKKSETNFEPREITTGNRSDNLTAILSGLREGEEVVSSANFLIDTESKMQAVIQNTGAKTPGHGSH